jgi:hypothetical protein
VPVLPQRSAAWHSRRRAHVHMHMYAGTAVLPTSHPKYCESQSKRGAVVSRGRVETCLAGRAPRACAITSPFPALNSSRNLTFVALRASLKCGVTVAANPVPPQVTFRRLLKSVCSSPGLRSAAGRRQRGAHLQCTCRNGARVGNTPYSPLLSTYLGPHKGGCRAPGIRTRLPAANCSHRTLSSCSLRAWPFDQGPVVAAAKLQCR